MNRRRAAAGAAAAVAVVVAGGGIFLANRDHPRPRPHPSPTRVVVPAGTFTPEPWVAGLLVYDGSWRVPADVPPGHYHTQVIGSLQACTWARVDKAGQVIAQGSLKHDEKGQLDVLTSDGGLRLAGGCTWKKDRPGAGTTLGPHLP